MSHDPYAEDMHRHQNALDRSRPPPDDVATQEAVAATPEPVAYTVVENPTDVRPLAAPEAWITYAEQCDRWDPEQETVVSRSLWRAEQQAEAAGKEVVALYTEPPSSEAEIVALRQTLGGIMGQLEWMRETDERLRPLYDSAVTALAKGD